MRFVAWRLAQLPVIVLAVYTITFALAWMLPGSAVINDEGRAPPQAVLDAIEQQYHLDNPFVFYTEYLAGATGARWMLGAVGLAPERPGAPVFDFGPSLRYEDWTVGEIISGTLPVSVVLGLAAIVIATVLGVSAGVIGALRPGSFADYATLSLALVGVSVPTFVIGAAFLIVFPVWLGVGSVGAWGSPGDVLLPALTLSLPFAAYIARLTRLGMIEQLQSDYIRTARAKGLRERDVVLRHALRNAMLPVVSYLGPAAAFAMTGSFVVEQVFNVPGIGQHFVSAVRNKDLFLIMGIVLIYASMLTVFNLLVDILYATVDPRIRQNEAPSGR